MVQSFSQQWTFEQDTTTFHWMKHSSSRLPSPHHLGSMKTLRYPLDASSSIFPGTYERNIEGFQLHHCLFAQHHYFQKKSRRTPRPHKTSFEKPRSAHLSMKLSKYHFFTKEIRYLGHMLSTKGIKPLPSKAQAIKDMHPPKIPNQVCAFLGPVGYYRKFFKIAKPLTLLTHQQAKSKWTPSHHNAFLTLKGSVIQAPILHYPNAKKCYIVYTGASDDACGAQLSQEHDGTEFPIAFLSHTLTDTQQKQSTTEQVAYSVYYMVTKWNYYVQGAEIIV